MIIVADTTPIHYLVLIGEIDLLKRLFGKIIIPPAVSDELRRKSTAEPVRAWMDSNPPWLETKHPSLALAELSKSLGTGERQAIALAVELDADALLVDDKRARNEASRRGIPVITILNTLEAAAERRWLDLPEVIQRLRQTSFYLPAEEVINQILERDKQRKERGE